MEPITKVLSSHKPKCIEGNADMLIESLSKVKSLAAAQAAFVYWLLSLYEICGGQDLNRVYFSQTSYITPSKFRSKFIET
jgi:hypothetical protein